MTDLRITILQRLIHHNFYDDVVIVEGLMSLIRILKSLFKETSAIPEPINPAPRIPNEFIGKLIFQGFSSCSNHKKQFS